MIIRANNKEIQVKSIFGDSFKRNGKTYPSFRFEFENEVTAEQVKALLSGSFDVLDNEGNVVYTHEGYNTLKSISVVIGKITTEEQRIEELEAENADLMAEKDELQNAVNVIVGGNA